MEEFIQLNRPTYDGLMSQAEIMKQQSKFLVYREATDYNHGGRMYYKIGVDEAVDALKERIDSLYKQNQELKNPTKKKSRWYYFLVSIGLKKKP